MRTRRRFAVPIRRTAGVILALSLAPAGVFAQNPLALQVSSETAPAGAMAQIKVFLTAPAPVGSGRIVMDLDPAVFGAIAGVSVFSAKTRWATRT